MGVPQRRKIILDCDPGVGIPGTDADDPIALMLAVADPRLELMGVTTVFGNCPPALGARGAAAVLRAAGRQDIPVAAGVGVPLSGRLPAELIEAYRGARGAEGRIELPEFIRTTADDHAVDLIIRTVRTYPGEITIVATGPQTNIALALLRAPDLGESVHEIIFMGGALGLDPTFGRGNITSVAECNIWFDPLAADVIFSAGIKLIMVGLDVTNPNKGLVLTAEMLRAVDPASSVLAPLFLEVCQTYFDAPMFDWAGLGGCVLYDPLAVAVAADDGIVVLEPMAIAVETRGQYTVGQTVPIRGGTPNMRVCVDVDGRSVVEQILSQVTANGSRWARSHVS